MGVLFELESGLLPGCTFCRLLERGLMFHFLKLLLFHERLFLQLSHNGVANARAELDGRQGMVEVVGGRARAGDEYDVGHGCHSVL